MYISIQFNSRNQNLIIDAMTVYNLLEPFFYYHTVLKKIKNQYLKRASYLGRFLYLNRAFKMNKVPKVFVMRTYNPLHNLSECLKVRYASTATAKHT